MLAEKGGAGHGSIASHLRLLNPYRGNGRYPAVKKEFQFALTSDVSTAVSVTFEGDSLSGTDNVLYNAYSGNDNICVQMLFNDNTPVKLEIKNPVISSAQEHVILKFNAC